MKKKTLLALIAAMVVVACAVASAYAPAGGGLDIKINIEGEIKTYSYKVPFATTVKRVFKYGGSYYKFYKNEFFGNEKAFLRYLNAEIIKDIEELCESAYIPRKEPEARLSDDGFLYTEGQNGVRIDENDLLKKITYSLDSSAEVVAVKVLLRPKETVESLKKNTVELATFSTDCSTSGEGRKHNVSQACKKLDGAVVAPEGVLSFNCEVGARTESNGFKEAKVINNGEFVSGVGGGVCQVSTTLYNAWLLSGKTVYASATHSLPVSYVSPSLDAMVSEASDLVLSNRGRYPAYIRTRFDGKKITVTVYGEPIGYSVKLRSEIIKIIPGDYDERYGELDWAEGEEMRITKKAHDGVVSEAYRDFYKDGVLIRSEKIRRSVYRASKGEIVRRNADENNCQKNKSPECIKKDGGSKI